MKISIVAPLGTVGVPSFLRRLPINREHVLRALNFILRRTNRIFVARTFFGAEIYTDLRDLIPATIYYFGAWEPNVTNEIIGGLEIGDGFVDIGANIGYCSMLAATVVGPEGRVVAVEASPTTFRCLRNNLDRNGFASTRAINCAAAEHRSVVTLYSAQHGDRGSATTVPHEGRHAEARIEAIPLDEILQTQELACITMIKIDIEGAEVGVLRSILRLLPRLPRCRSVLSELNPESGGDELANVFASFLQAGFEAFQIQNRYNWGWYFGWNGPEPLTALKQPPIAQSDVLFRRPSRFFKQSTLGEG